MDHLRLELGLSTNNSPCLSSESFSSDNYCDFAKNQRFRGGLDIHDHVTNEDNDYGYKELDKNSSTTYNDEISDYVKSMRIKVTMEGVGIGRKVDLSLHHSYHTLARSLLAMFGKDEETMKHYEVVYQDVDGDWLLAGDVPWRTFVESARRLKLVRSNI